MRSVCAGVKTLGVKTLRMRSVCAHCAGGRPRMRLPLLAPIDETCGASPRLPLGRPRTSPISISLRAHSRSRSRSCSPPPDQLWYNRIPLLPSPVHLTSRRVRSEYSARHLFHPSYIMPGMPPMPSSIPAMPSSFSFTCTCVCVCVCVCACACACACVCVCRGCEGMPCPCMRMHACMPRYPPPPATLSSSSFTSGIKRGGRQGFVRVGLRVNVRVS